MQQQAKVRWKEPYPAMGIDLTNREYVEDKRVAPKPTSEYKSNMDIL